jgi:hypothetical protein
LKRERLDEFGLQMLAQMPGGGAGAGDLDFDAEGDDEGVRLGE